MMSFKKHKHESHVMKNDMNREEEDMEEEKNSSRMRKHFQNYKENVKENNKKFAESVKELGETYKKSVFNPGNWFSKMKMKKEKKEKKKAMKDQRQEIDGEKVTFGKERLSEAFGDVLSSLPSYRVVMKPQPNVNVEEDDVSVGSCNCEKCGENDSNFHAVTSGRPMYLVLQTEDMEADSANVFMHNGKTTVEKKKYRK